MRTCMVYNSSMHRTPLALKHSTPLHTPSHSTPSHQAGMKWDEAVDADDDTALMRWGARLADAIWDEMSFCYGIRRDDPYVSFKVRAQ